MQKATRAPLLRTGGNCTPMTGGENPALQLVLSGDPGLFAIVRLSLLVSLSAVLLAALIGVPAGALSRSRASAAARPSSSFSMH